LVTLQRLAVVGVGAGGRVNREFNLLDILVGLSGNGLNRWPEVVDHIVIGNNVGDILGLINDLNVSFGRFDVLRVTRSRPMRIGNKGVSRRSNVIV
jgi:hypothetical protein